MGGTKIEIDTQENAVGTALRGIMDQNLPAVRAAFRAFPSIKDTDDLLKPWLIEAVTFGNLETIEFLIDEGCDINDTADQGSTSVITAAMLRRRFDLLDVLFKHGADPNLPKTRTLLSAINAGENRLELVKLLVENGADVNLVFDLNGDPDEVPQKW